jgi:FkbM family methyltransferase
VTVSEHSATYLGRGRLLIKTSWGGKLFAPADDLSLTPDLVVHGHYDAPFLRCLERSIVPGDTAVDVGANIGVFTLRMAELTGPSGRVIALEPNPACRKFLVDTITANYYSWVDLLDVAAGAVAGTAELDATERFLGNSSLLPRDADYFRRYPNDRTTAVSVNVVVLDELLADVGPIALVKIDVEGAEPQVLAGMAKLMERRAVRWIDVEAVRSNAPGEWAALLGIFASVVATGCHLAEIQPDGTLSPVSVAEIDRRGALPHVVITAELDSA